MSHLLVSVILNWNNVKDLAVCLKSMKKVRYSAFRTIVVDQGSQDGSVEMVKRDYPSVILIENGKNVGHSTGNNIGIRNALELGAKYIFLQDNDTEVQSDMFDALVAALKDPEIGVAAPVVYFSGGEKIWSAGGKIERRSFQHLHLCENGQKDDLPEQDLWDVDFVPSCGMLVRRDVFEKGLLFDESFFVYHNDVDFCLKCWQKEYRVVVVKQASMIHKVSGTVGAYSPMMTYYKGRNKLILYKRYGKLSELPFFLKFHLKKAIGIVKDKRNLSTLGALAKAVLHGTKKGR